ncbi:MAG TPA: methyltransferase domain-containing protein [Xanthobacteraceae bacterium]|nr:methyltransferase domain-containing protein [Xanthobacteraceae bacterium]
MSVETKERSVAATPVRARASSLREALAPLGIEHNEAWAWANYERVVRELVSAFGARRLIEIGGGRDPLFSRASLAELGAELTVNDISSVELATLPAGYRTACFDIAGTLTPEEIARGGYDLAFSRMVFEHVADGKRAWENLFRLLAPGGVGLAFVPTLYAFPFVVNWLLPDDFAAKIVKLVYKNRTDHEDPVFPARYSWTVASEKKLAPMLSAIGYRDVKVVPFYGHGYYQPFPFLRDIHAKFTALARDRDWRFFASYAYIAARK